jgi:hypothetical protein
VASLNPETAAAAGGGHQQTPPFKNNDKQPASNDSLHHDKQSPSKTGAGGAASNANNAVSNSQNMPRILLYSVFPGNGPQVIRDAMARRSNGKIIWKEVSKDQVTYSNDQQINFIWKPNQFNFKLYSVIDRVLNESYNY